MSRAIEPQFTHQITEVTKFFLNSFDQEPLEHPVSTACPAVATTSFPRHLGTYILIDDGFESSLTRKQALYGTGKESARGRRCTHIFAQKPAPTASIDWCDLARVTIDMLPDVALLEIFDFYVDWTGMNAWHTLVHVCRNWRNVVYGSPRRLDLKLHFSPRVRVRKMLNVWPLLPIIMEAHRLEMLGPQLDRVDNVVAALEHNNRVHQLTLIDISSSQFEKVSPPMQELFPELSFLDLRIECEINETAPVVPASFLGGSAPRLQTLRLIHIPFPGLPKLLLSASHLVHLDLRRIPHSGYFSPEAIVTSLSVLTRLNDLVIYFESPRSLPDRTSRRPPPATRITFPVLTALHFKGAGEYFEDLLARIDAPLLNTLTIIFFNQLIFDTPQLTQFIDRTPEFRTHDKAQLFLSSRQASVALAQSFNRGLELGISCRRSDWQLSSLAQICTRSFPRALIPALERLYIFEDSNWIWQHDNENSQWLELFHPFTAVKELYISREFAPLVAPALQELAGGGVMEVLPALQTLFLEERLSLGPVQEAIEKFVAARQHVGHPIAISRCERKLSARLSVV